MKQWLTGCNILSDAARNLRALALALRTVLRDSGDVLVDDSARGIVLKSPNGHYWRATISNVGTVTWTDLGTTAP